MTGMKLSVTMMSFQDRVKSEKMSVAQFIDECAALGVDAVDILEYFWQDKEREISEIPGQLKAKGLEIGAFCVGNNFVALPEDHQKQVDYVLEGLRTASRLGAKRMRIFGGSQTIPEGIRAEDRMGLVIDGIKKCIGAAEKYGIVMALENHGGIPITSDEVLEILRAVDSPWLKVNFDMGNFLSYVGEDPLKAAEKLYKYVDLIHIKDLKLVDGKYKSCVVGEGVVPVKECLEFFGKMGYNGYASLEYEGWELAGSTEGVARSVEYLKGVLKKD